MPMATARCPWRARWRQRYGASRHRGLAGRGTHLAAAEAPGAAVTAAQLAWCAARREALAALGVAPAIVHIASPAGAVRFPAARATAVRPGILLYGGGPDVQ